MALINPDKLKRPRSITVSMLIENCGHNWPPPTCDERSQAKTTTKALVLRRLKSSEAWDPTGFPDVHWWILTIIGKRLRFVQMGGGGGRISLNDVIQHKSYSLELQYIMTHQGGGGGRISLNDVIQHKSYSLELQYIMTKSDQAF